MQCPKCGASDRLNIAATVWVRLSLDGTDATEAENGDHEWDKNSAIVCRSCGQSGTVASFTKAGSAS